MDITTFTKRRKELRTQIKNGAILFLGLDDAPRNYSANTYPFRQDSHFLYYVGTNLPGMAVLIMPDGETIMFGALEDPDDLVWHGPHPVLADHAKMAGIAKTEVIGNLKKVLKSLQSNKIEIHYLPPYRAESTLKFSTILNLPWQEIKTKASSELAFAVSEQRSIKSAAEITQMEKALSVSAKMYDAALSIIAPGKFECEIAGAMQAVALSHDMPQSFLPIVTVRGEVLHNNTYTNKLKDGDMLLVDSGVEAPPHYYASDITRTFPVSGKYNNRQKGVYQIVLDMQLAAIAAASPKFSNRELHIIAAKTAVSGLKNLGLMKGNTDEAVKAGAHALFYPHGLGHMIGGDVHDMEDLGDVVGYPNGEKRSEQFGLAFLRLAKKLQPGFVITVEPGIYFVPALIDRWKAENKHPQFINYNEVEKYRDFGGVRIEDDILITETGCRVLGEGIPKNIEEIEAKMAK